MFEKLSNEQRTHIAGKVRELGSVKAVEAFYSPHPKSKDQTLSTVDKYARAIAGKILSKREDI